MQPIERKRQGYIHELIQTEERYMADLQLVVEVRRLLLASARGICCLPREMVGTRLRAASTQRQSKAALWMCEFTDRDGSSHTLQMPSLPAG